MRRGRAALDEAGAAPAEPRCDRRVPRRSRVQAIAVRRLLGDAIRDKLADAVVAKPVQRLVVWLRCTARGRDLLANRGGERRRECGALLTEPVHPPELALGLLPPAAHDLRDREIHPGDVPDGLAVPEPGLRCVSATRFVFRP